MIKVLIIDDEPLARQLIREYLISYKDINIVQECSDGFEGLKAIQSFRPNLIFLDIQMPKINGFEMLELVDEPQKVIFTTAFDHYALKAFEANAIDYLLKPFSKDRFDQAITKCLTDNTLTQLSQNLIYNSNEFQPESASRIALKVNGDIKVLPTTEVVYMEAYDDYVKIFTLDMSYVKKQTMSFYEKTLNKNLFVRIHRSYILNLSFLNSIEQKDKDSYLAVTKNGIKLILSRTGYSLLKEKLGL